MWRYHLEDDDGKTVAIVHRMARPTIQKIITHLGQKWSVWYIEEGAGAKNARCERVVSP